MLTYVRWSVQVLVSINNLQLSLLVAVYCDTTEKPLLEVRRKEHLSKKSPFYGAFNNLLDDSFNHYFISRQQLIIAHETIFCKFQFLRLQLFNDFY